MLSMIMMKNTWWIKNPYENRSQSTIPQIWGNIPGNIENVSNHLDHDGWRMSKSSLQDSRSDGFPNGKAAGRPQSSMKWPTGLEADPALQKPSLEYVFHNLVYQFVSIK